MPPSQNFLLHNGTAMQIIKKEKFKLVWRFLPLFAVHVPYTNYNNLISKEEQTILKPAKKNHKCTNEINTLLSKQFSECKFQNFFVKNEKNR